MHLAVYVFSDDWFLLVLAMLMLSVACSRRSILLFGWKTCHSSQDVRLVHFHWFKFYFRPTTKSKHFCWCTVSKNSLRATFSQAFGLIASSSNFKLSLQDQGTNSVFATETWKEKCATACKAVRVKISCDNLAKLAMLLETVSLMFTWCCSFDAPGICLQTSHCIGRDIFRPRE